VPRGPFGRIEDKHGVGEPGYEPPVPPPEKPEPPPAGPKRWHERWSWRILIVLIVFVLFAGWRAGTFDHALVNVGLNAKPCARNGLGATFCGQELTEYRERLAHSKEEGEAASRKIEEAASKAQRESQQYIQKAQREGREYQQRSEEALKRSTEAQQQPEEGSG
jgi:hypothetical protein